MEDTMSQMTVAPPPEGGLGRRYSGFWRRCGAILIDGAVLFVITLPVKLLFGYGLFPKRPADHNYFGNNASAGWAYLAYSTVSLVLTWIYFSASESSVRQATLGKMAFGIIVTDENGSRISFGRATGRFFSKLVSWFTLGIGFMVAGWTSKKQALHDLMARTLVVQKDPDELPRSRGAV